MNTNQSTQYYELALISLCARKPDIFNAVDKFVGKELFSVSVNWHIYSAIRQYHSEKSEYDYVELLSFVAQRVSVETDYLDQALQAPANERNYIHYLDALKNAALLHRLINFVGECSDFMTPEAKSEPVALAEKMQQRLTEISLMGSRESDGDIASAAREILDDIENPDYQPTFPTGFNRLDDIIGGLRKGALLTVAADTGGGKTCFAVNVACNQVFRFGKKALIVSMEMKRKSLMARILSSLTSIPSWKIEKARLNVQELQAISAMVTKMEGFNDKLIISQNPRMTPDDIMSEVRYQSLEQPVDLLVIDYLQLIELNTNDDSYERISKVSRTIKEISMRFNIPVIVISQFNREKHRRAQDDKAPKLSDLKGSGNIEQDSDVVLFIQADKTESKEQNAQFHVAKNRYGQEGEFYLPFSGEISTFTNEV